METSLLTTKLNIPPTRPQLVSRPRLFECLQEGLKYGLILVSAPAGFGKTTLLSEWIRQQKNEFKSAWFSIEKGDNDPVRFWDYFIASLRTIHPDYGQKALSILHSSQPPPIESLLTILINDLSSIAGSFVIVLDDYHLIESQQIHDGVNYLLEHMPVQMNLIIATRADPPLSLARFRGKGMILEIGADDLRFSQDEVTNLLDVMNIPDLSFENISALNERTEGWVVGLKMVALSMKGQKDIPGFIKAFTGSHRYIMDYLLDEVLQKQTQDVRDFLCKTSILERLSGPLCDAITGLDDSGEILIELERSHLFIVPLDESRQWYRYEHLFADLLRHQYLVTHGTEQVVQLNQRASQWYEDNNLLDEAIHHALAARDWERTMRLIDPRSDELRKLAQFDTLLGWFDEIPREILCTNHQLYSQYAAVLTVVSRFDEAEAALNYLERHAHDNTEIQGEAAFSLANIARLRGDFPRCIDMAEKALSILPQDSFAMRARTSFTLGWVLYDSGRFNVAEKYLNDACELGYKVNEITAAASAEVYLGSMMHFSGKSFQAIDILKKTLETTGQTRLGGGILCHLSKVNYELNNLEEAAENARLSIELGELGVIAEGRLISYFVKARILLAEGDETGAAAAMAKMDEANRDPTISASYHARHAACRTIFSIRQNDMEAATEWGRRLASYPDILHFEYQYIPGRLLIAQGKKQEAVEYLRDLYDRLIQISAHGLAVAVRVCQALAADTEEVAMEFLTDALIKGESYGYIRSFVDEGELLKPLLEKAISRGITPGYSRKLLAIIEAEEHRKLKKKMAGETPSRLKSLLSERELEVLRLMAEGLSNQQIADRLIISLGTAKNHVHNILEKLNVKSRIQAITQARELELV